MISYSMNVQLAQKQSLVFTPQLQQAIKLLLLTNIDLSSYAEKLAEENPFLEVELPSRGSVESRNSITSMPSTSPQSDFDPVSLLVDTSGASFGARLFQQVEETLKNPFERKIGYAIASHVEPSGWLSLSTCALAESLGVDEKFVEQALTKLQSAEPSGLFARNLAECLRLQISTSDYDYAKMTIIIDNLPLVARGALTALRRKTGCHADDIRRLLQRLRSLDPKPGLALFNGIAPPVRQPDIITGKTLDGEWFVEMNQATLPIIKVDEVTGHKVRKLVNAPQDQAFVRDTLGNARWLSRAIAQRNETSIKIAAEIVRIQKPFLEHGIQHMRPLKLKTVADAVGVHESTISRVTSSLMMQTPQGTYPLKIFFSTAIELGGHDEGVSARVVREKIRSLVGAEVPGKPLSDEIIVQELNRAGLNIARRTIAKYRKLDKIPSSFQRRRNYQLQGIL
jgi:RNA polymerase sigma-54 factor